MTFHLHAGSPPHPTHLPMVGGPQTSTLLPLPAPGMQKIFGLIGPKESCKVMLLCHAHREEYAKDSYWQHIYVSLYDTADIPFDLTYFHALGPEGKKVADFMRYKINTPSDHDIRSPSRSAYKKIALSGNRISLDREDLGVLGKQFKRLPKEMQNGLSETRALLNKTLGQKAVSSASAADFVKIRSVLCEKIISVVLEHLHAFSNDTQNIVYVQLFSEIVNEQWISTPHAVEVAKRLVRDYPLRLIVCVDKLSDPDSFKKMRSLFEKANSCHESSFNLGKKRDPLFNSSDSDSDSSEDGTAERTETETPEVYSSCSEQPEDDDVFFMED